MIDPHTRTCFNSEWNLESWHPVGVLNVALATLMVHYIGFEERIKGLSFNRFADMSGLRSIELTDEEIAGLAAERKASFEGLPPGKAAFFAPGDRAYEVSETFACFMRSSDLEVKVFREMAAAAEWLGIPIEALRPEG
ncbi:MAG: hypothetical protein V4640_04150 [Verrucomicrobiota bacterium]